MVENRLIEPEDESDSEADASFENTLLEHKRWVRERALINLEEYENRILSLDDETSLEADRLRKSIGVIKKHLEALEPSDEGAFSPPE